MQGVWFFPRDTQQLIYFYFAVCIIYLVIHLIWDWWSDITPPFTLRRLQYKLHQVFSSATFASSLFFVVIAMDLNNPLRQSEMFIFPLICTSLCGIMVSLANIVPDACVQGEIKQ